jgi:site-specific DNA-methyltransferase (adenine-specific)
MPDTPPNTLYYGDNLDVLRRYIDDESVDLIYLDPPFNSNADYNVLFAEKDGTQAHAQIKAFEDTWTWDLEAAQEYAEVLRSGHDRLAKALKGLHDFLGGSDMLAYLSMMGLRLIELRRVLKSTAATPPPPITSRSSWMHSSGRRFSKSQAGGHIYGLYPKAS